MRRLLLALVLVGCAPRAQSPFQQNALPAETTRELLGSFAPGLSRSGIQALTAAGQRTLPNTEDALLLVAQQFKQGSAGFCPLAENAFVPDDTGRRFMTLLARGTDVRLLIYDRTATEGLRSVVVVGKTASPPSTKPCT